MKYTTFASLAVVTALGFLTPINANAFGLGKIELSSALNEPFKAEISVTALRDDDAENLEIRLASNDEFIKAGLERSLILTQLKFELVEKPKGLVILVSSKQAVKEPFLDFLLTATTGEGKLIREYTVLLDPPKEIFNRPVEVKTTSAPTTTTNNPTVSKPSQNKTTYQYPSSDLSSASSYGPTGRADTLWDIALKTRPQTSVSVHQMMMAIIKENPRAFTKNNINGLKAGYTLDLPSAELIDLLSKAQAVLSVAEQNTSWKNRNKTSAPVNTTTAQSDVPITDNIEQQDGVVEADDMSATSAASTSSVSGESDTEAHLQLVVPADDSSMNDEDLSLSGNKELRKLSEQLTLAEETLEGQVQENIEFKERMSAMEEQLETMRRLISLKDADLARLQSSLEKEEASTTEPSDEMTSLHEEAIALLDQYAEDANLGEETDQDTSIGIDEEMVLSQDGDMPLEDSFEDTAELLELGITEQPASETVMDEMDLSNIPFAEDIISKTSEIMDVDESEIKSSIAGVKQFITERKIETALGGVLILLLLLLFIRNRKNAGVSWDEAVEKLPDTPAAPVMMENPEMDNDGAGVIGEKSTDDDFQVKTVEDLIEQADIFVGYADYEQAKTSLDLAKQMEPANEKVIQKLLFIAFKQQEVDAFIDLAGQTTADKSSAEWEEITAWGREIAPEHDMFMLDETGIEPLSADMEDEAISEIEEPLNIDIEEEEESDHLEFNLDGSNSGNVSGVDLDSASAETGEDELLDFDVNSDDDSDDLEVEAPSSSDSSGSDDAVDNDELSFDVDGLSDFDTPLTMDETSLNDDEVLVLDDEPMTLDLGDSDTDIGSIELDTLGSISEQDLDAATRELSESLEDSIEMGEDSDTADLTFDIGEIDEIDETETKLDLADAYMDMGDPEGARNILEEVMADANDEQKERAQRMLKDL